MKYIFALCAYFCFSTLSAEIVPQTATLANGIKIIVFKNPILPSVTVWTHYDVGTADDPVDLVGLSHMLEHMMFKGTPTYPEGSIDKIINKIGGELNAFTNFDFTVYTFSVPAQYLELILSIEADRMVNLNFSEQIFLTEQKVVLEERQMRIGNHPLRTAAEVCRRVQFIAHPYGIHPIGYEGHIKAYTHDVLMNHYKKWYAPNNATVIVVGPYDLSYVLPLCEAKFGKLAQQDLPSRERLMEPNREGLTTTVEQENPRSENIYIEISYRVPTLIKKPEEFQKMQMMISTLFGSDSRLIYKKMVKEKRLALDVSGNYSCGKDDMDFTFSLQLAPNMSVDVAEAFLFEQLQLILQNGLNENDFKAAKQDKLNAFAFAMDGEGFLVAMAEQIVEGLPIEAISKYEQLIKDVTIEQAHEMLALVFANRPVLIARNYPMRKMPARNYLRIGQEIELKNDKLEKNSPPKKKTTEKSAAAL